MAIAVAAVARTVMFAGVARAVALGAQLIHSLATTLSETVTFTMTDASSTTQTGDDVATPVAVGGSGLLTQQFTNPSGVYSNNVMSLTTSAAGAHSPSSYATFTVTGTAITLRSIALKGFRGGATTPRGFAIGVIVDGGTETMIATGQNIGTVRPIPTNYSWTGLAFTGNTIEVRIHPYAPATTATVEFDDLVLTVTKTA